MPPVPATSEMLAEMSACAYRLGVAFGEEAERTEDWPRKLEMFQLFDRCFFAVRVATSLQLRLRREVGAGLIHSRAPEAETLRERESLEAERPDSCDPGAAEPARERPDRDEADRERDREAERASLPVLLTTLKGVAADAAALPGPRPAALPTLQELLAQATDMSSPRPRDPIAGTPLLRDRLAGSAAVAVAVSTGPPRASPGPGLPPRRATGPPRR